MALLDRLKGGENKISIHRFAAMMGQYERGEMTGLQVVEMLGLSQAEEAELQGFLDKIDLGTTPGQIGDSLMLLETGDYQVADVEAGLGLAVGEV